jgi:hypothetical protein
METVMYEYIIFKLIMRQDYMGCGLDLTGSGYDQICTVVNMVMNLLVP